VELLLGIATVVGVAVGVLSLGLAIWTRRTRIRLRLDTSETLLALFGRGPALMARHGVLRAYNAGSSPITVNAAGWEAKDGTRVEAHVPEPVTLSPGGPELEAAADVGKLVAAHDQHGGLVTMYVELAGETKPRTATVPPDWLPKVRELAAKDRR
jgi:hypothetical protein